MFGSRVSRLAAALLLAGAVLVPAGNAAVPQWQAVPLVSAAARAAGHTGGEGCQQIMSVAIDATGQFLVMATDVGGLYRSLNGGKTWTPCNVGYKPRGAICVAIDPNSSRRVIAVGSNSANVGNWHGLWLSVDAGATWESVLPKGGNYGLKQQFVFDPSSKAGGLSRVAYWSCPASGGGGLYKTTDGGLTWAQISPNYHDCTLAVHPTKGYLYLANENGLYRSTDGGATFPQLIKGDVRGVDTSAAAPDRVIITQGGYEIDVSNDAGQTWTKKAAQGLPTSSWHGGKGWFAVRASPADANFLTLSHDTGYWAQVPRFFSHDGGDTWAAPTFDTTASFIPANLGRPETPAFDPADKNVIFSNGGDFLTKSADGGAHYTWNNDGYNGVCASGNFNFNPLHSGLLLLTSQDYNSASTTDGGHTWVYQNVSGNGWGGFNYSGYALSPQVMFAGNADSWGGDRTLFVTQDGGKTWVNTGHVGGKTYLDTACGDPTDLKVGFWNNWRTGDSGKTWTALNGCDGVLTYNPNGKKELYGRYQNSLVRSGDHGVTWQTVCAPNTNWLVDAAIDPARHLFYLCTDQRHLFQYNAASGAMTDITSRLPTDNNGAQAASTVACDPLHPEIVYAGAHADVYATSAAVMCSTDAGKTWTVLTRQPGQDGPDGGHEATCIRVNPVTRALWVSGQCYGIWRFPAP